MSPMWRMRWLSCYIAVRKAFERKWEIIRDDPIAWTEMAGGALLVALRGLIFKWGNGLNMPDDVVEVLLEVGVTEQGWATYLMWCGLAQICFAGTRHSTGRLIVTIAILAGFGVMLIGYHVSNVQLMPHGKPTIVPSLVCMTAFYTLLLARVFRDRDPDHRPAGERRHAAP